MRVLVTGATGLVGRALVPLLQGAGHTVVASTRSESRARNRLGADVEIVSSDLSVEALAQVLATCDGVVNLAGEPIVGRRWTAKRRAALERSRIDTTARLVAAIVASDRRPRVLVSASAVGIYGDRGDESLTEQSSPGTGFLAALCRSWEAAAAAAPPDVRVVLLRTGIVLGQGGGALAAMSLPFKAGVGGPVGSGRQFVPWIHLHDVVRVIATALTDARYAGAINLVAPDETTNRVFAQTLARTLHRPALIPAPAFAIRLILGEAAGVLLSSQRVQPQALAALGFPFRFPTLARALHDIIRGDTAVSIAPASARPAAARAATYELRVRTIVAAPPEQTFAFFSKAENLGLITPPAMQFAIDGRAPEIRTDAVIRYRIRIGPLTMSWRTRIAAWEPGRAFVDVQEAGPYRCWWHEHSFTADGGRTVMDDRVLYAPPLGFIGRLAHRLFIAPTLRAIFKYRGDVIRLRFGGAEF